MVYHKSKHKMLCHHCGDLKELKKKCISCGKIEKKINLGYGIEKVTEEIKNLFPKTKVVSLSSDNIKNQNFSLILKEIEEGNIKIIIGTQIISKGFNFKHLNSVFILDFDIWFYNTDIRTNEKIFQLTQQVSGRTSRDKKTGEVYIQTYNPNNNLLNLLKSNKRDKFYENELLLRKKISLPPYIKLVAIILSSKDKNLLINQSLNFKKLLNPFSELLILGPIPAPIEFIKGQYRYRILIKTHNPFFAQKILRKYNFEKLFKNRIKIKIDIDPLSFF